MRFTSLIVGIPLLLLANVEAGAQDWQRRLNQAAPYAPPTQVPRTYEAPTYTAPQYTAPSTPSWNTPSSPSYSNTWSPRPAAGPYDNPTLGDPAPRVWGQTPTLGDPRPYRNTNPRTCRGLLCD